MTKFKLLSAAAILSAAMATPAMAQQVIYNPGYCAQFYPDANCQNKGPTICPTIASVMPRTVLQVSVDAFVLAIRIGIELGAVAGVVDHLLRHRRGCHGGRQDCRRAQELEFRHQVSPR